MNYHISLYHMHVDDLDSKSTHPQVNASTLLTCLSYPNTGSAARLDEFITEIANGRMVHAWMVAVLRLASISTGRDI
jgi:hypothetical protein